MICDVLFFTMPDRSCFLLKMPFLGLCSGLHRISPNAVSRPHIRALLDCVQEVPHHFTQCCIEAMQFVISSHNKCFV